MSERRLRLVLLPGLDGTGRLFAPLIERLPSWLEPLVIGYPVDRMLTYDNLVEYVLERLPEGPYILLGESFSGPVAIRIATESSSPPLALILVATFARYPLPRPLASILLPLARPALFRMTPFPLISHILLGPGASDALVDRLRGAIESVDPAVIAHRVRSVLRVDLRETLKRCPLPILYLGATRDWVVGSRSLRVVRRCRPDTEVIRIDAPHLLLQKEPEAGARAIERFLVSSSLPRP
jgi:pimeloyl-ACP methyl ester carboxylesterase